MKTLTYILFKWFFFRVLTGRYISIEKPMEGRYTKRQLTKIHNKIKKEQHDILLKSDLSQYKTQGNRLMVYCGIISLAAYRTLRSEGVTHSYAITLIADVIWKLYILGAKFLWLITGLIMRKHQKRLNLTLRLLCKYPFNVDPKGYQYKVNVMPDHMAMNFTQCVVHQFMKTTGNDDEMDFFRKSWCLYDFALPTYLIEGGGYERVHTLSHGDNICDMKWYAKFTRSK